MDLKPIVLIIEDDPTLRAVMEGVLPKLGLFVHAVASYEEFLEKLKEVQPDLFLIDLKLDGISGFEIIQNLRNQGSRTPIVVLSGAEERGDLLHALEAGANDFIRKPPDFSLLSAKLSQYLKTDFLKDQDVAVLDIPEGETQGRLTFDVQITEIDELGVTFKSTHLIPKATVLKIKSDLFQQMGPAVEILASITNNEFRSDKGVYYAYAEFEDVSQEFSESLRLWLKKAHPDWIEG